MASEDAVNERANRLLDVWMSHGDKVSAAILLKGLWQLLKRTLAHFAACGKRESEFFGVQFTLK